MPFYTYRQNNSGGRFDIDIERGIGTIVIIEAHDAAMADALATYKGLYFNYDEDCSCCGARWNPANTSWADEGTDRPEVYGKPIEEYRHWTGEHMFVHYLDGTVKEYDGHTSEEETLRVQE